MASQALLTADPALELQRDVQRKLGRCLLRLQQYEILLKALVAHGDIAAVLAGVDAKAELLRARPPQFQTLKCGLVQKRLTSEWRVRVDSAAVGAALAAKPLAVTVLFAAEAAPTA